MTRLRATLTVEYTVSDPDHYGTVDPGEQAAIDEDSFLDDPASMIATAEEWGDYKVSVEVIE